MSQEESKQLIKDYLEGRLSKEECAGIETWYLSVLEQEQPSAIERDYEKTGEKIWQGVISAIDTNTNRSEWVQPTATLYPSLKKFIGLGIAASLLIIAAIGFLVFNQKNTQPDRFVVASKYDLAPGKPKAILTLSDGRVIDLEKDTGHNISGEAGVEITRSGKQTLVYKAEKSNTKPGYNTISIPAGAHYAVLLPDGSKVWLNASSSLKYPTIFNPLNREVSLSGEAYFEIAHMDGKTGRIPFTVSVVQGPVSVERVKVLGTHFNINAYSDEPAIKTTLLQGSVSVTSNKGQTALLKPGEQARLNEGQLKLGPADTEMAVAWKDGDFVFREDLRSAMRKVARWYDVEVIYEDTAPQNLMLGGWMSRSNKISEVLNHIQLTGKVHFKLEGRRVFVSK